MSKRKPRRGAARGCRDRRRGAGTTTALPQQAQDGGPHLRADQGSLRDGTGGDRGRGELRRRAPQPSRRGRTRGHLQGRRGGLGRASPGGDARSARGRGERGRRRRPAGRLIRLREALGGRSARSSSRRRSSSLRCARRSSAPPGIGQAAASRPKQLFRQPGGFEGLLLASVGAKPSDQAAAKLQLPTRLWCQWSHRFLGPCPG